MTYIVPFEDEFLGEIRKIYAVSEDNPEGHLGGSITTGERCPHCKANNIFRVYEQKRDYIAGVSVVEVYDCKCPSCRKEFDLEVIHKL